MKKKIFWKKKFFWWKKNVFWLKKLNNWLKRWKKGKKRPKTIIKTVIFSVQVRVFSSYRFLVFFQFVQFRLTKIFKNSGFIWFRSSFGFVPVQVRSSLPSAILSSLLSLVDSVPALKLNLSLTKKKLIDPKRFGM